MGIFTRFRDIVGSNINSMLDRAEDPEKLIKLMIQEMEDTLIELKSACAGVMAESKKIERRQLTLDKRVDYWKEKANLAVDKGRDDLAREALLEKRRYSRRTEALAAELTEHQALSAQYKEEIGQLEEKLKSAREKERMLVQRHIHAARKKRAQEEIRRMDSADAVFKFEELEHRIEHMEAEADLVNFGRKPALEDELERLSLDEEIESELQAIKASSIDKMEERVEVLETIIGAAEREGANHEQI
jgi:phage shock protein A